jgi:hypothetical protein
MRRHEAALSHTRNTGKSRDREKWIVTVLHVFSPPGVQMASVSTVLLLAPERPDGFHSDKSVARAYTHSSR